MLERKMTAQLLEWKESSTAKVFILLGARQTGKTYVVRHFARANYSNYLEVNFLDDQENGRFLAGAHSSEELASRLSLIAGHELSPDTLVFFDEVQELGHDVITLSKFLVEDSRFRLVLSGSLLGTRLKGVRSFPVGYARIERMSPLDFEEFCWAMGVPQAILDSVGPSFAEKTPVEETLHDKLIQLFRRYVVVGGMPEAVQSFLDSGRELGSARAVDAEIAEQYRFDIVKYAQERKTTILGTYNALPSQLAKENKRFMLSAVTQDGRYERLKDDFGWLTEAGVALPCTLVKEPKYPLQRTEVPERFKLYASDSGVLLAQYPLGAARGIVEGRGDMNFGAVYEKIVAQQLVTAGFPLRYFQNNRKGEVDFVIEDSEGRVVPIEVKSGKDYKLHVALNNLLATPDYGVPWAFVLSEANVSIEERDGKPVYYLPLYMTMSFSSLRDDGWGKVPMEEIAF